MAWELSGNAGTTPPKEFLGTRDQQPLVIKTNDREAMRITSGGRVGIGTRDPGSYRLMVAGGDIRIAEMGKEGSIFGLDRIVGLNDLRFYVDDVGITEQMHLDSNGLRVERRVRVKAGLNVDDGDGSDGTFDPKEPAGFLGITFGSIGSGEGIVSSRTGQHNLHGLDFYTGYQSRLSIANSGDVGIGTISPTAKLTVDGDIRINDHDLWLRGANDKNHGLGWYGPGKAWGIESRGLLSEFPIEPDGPVLFGWGGGVLGTTQNQNYRPALTWYSDDSVTVWGGLTAKSSTQVDGPLFVNPPDFENAIYVSSQKWSGSKWRIYRNAADAQFEPNRQAQDYGLCMHDCDTRKGVTFKKDGSIFIDGTLHQSSDMRLKRNVKSLADALSRLLSLRGVSYEWKDAENNPDRTRTQMGFISQEVESVFPEWVSEDHRGLKMLTTSGLGAMTVEAIRELKYLFDGLVERIDVIESARRHQEGTIEKEAVRG